MTAGRLAHHALIAQFGALVRRVTRVQFVPCLACIGYCSLGLYGLRILESMGLSFLCII
jgi:hypothetical protein